MFIMALAMIFVLTACGKGGSSNSKGDGKSVEIKHALGTTEIKGKPKRVVTLYQGATDISVLLQSKKYS